MPQKLIPPDKKRCQSEIPAMFALGGTHRRCDNIPKWIAKENKAQKDGCKGSMSLCDECKKVFIKQMGKDYASFKEIK